MEMHILPLQNTGDAGKYILYRPLVGLAFVGNRAMADLAARATLEPGFSTAGIPGA